MDMSCTKEQKIAYSILFADCHYNRKEYNRMQILNYKPSGTKTKLNFSGQEIEIQNYCDILTVKFDNDKERDNNRIIYHNNKPFYYSHGTKQKDNTYITEYHNEKPVY